MKDTFRKDKGLRLAFCVIKKPSWSISLFTHLSSKAGQNVFGGVFCFGVGRNSLKSEVENEQNWLITNF
jgi:hypothetical protein